MLDWLQSVLSELLKAYIIVCFVLVVLVPVFIAKPPWHRPDPDGTLSDHSLPLSYLNITSPPDLNLPHTEVSFTTYGNLTLRGWLVPGRSPDFHSGTSPQSATDRHVARPPAAAVGVVCVHGAGRDRRAFLRHSRFLHAAGFDTLLFDCANHGTSDAVARWPWSPWPGRAITLGTREHRDVAASVAFMRGRGTQSVVVLATSQGASSAIIAAARGAPIDVLLLENPFVAPSALIASIVQTIFSRMPYRLFPGLLAHPIAWLSLFKTGNLPEKRQLRAMDFMAQVHQPVMFIHGTQDIMVPKEQSEMLFREVRHDKRQLWIVDGAAHTQCFHQEPEAFEMNVLGFIRKHSPGTEK